MTVTSSTPRLAARGPRAEIAAYGCARTESAI